ncbi:DNA topoisomerase [Mortierella sp. AD010]|nr:DNA topoisomerase [Mortierella sp. AD010]
MLERPPRPCQFPTLGFVVDQYRRVENFIPENFWKLEMKYNKDGLDATFVWQRGHLFDQLACLVIYESCLEAGGPNVIVTKVKSNPTTKYRPLPLTTVELQKNGSKFLSIPSDEIMTAAENLYVKGWISYPRTETDQFDLKYDLASLVEKQTQNSQWGRFAQRLTEGGYRNPRKGKNNDQAHPPIHPVMHTDNLDGNEKKVYEFITRRFLACCAEDAKGDQTDVEVKVNTETFKATGLIIKERNYLDVYPYDKWTGAVLPNFVEGEEFIPTEFSMKSGATSPPTLLTESQLISLMDKNGIGTDATIAEHIKTITKREYVVRSKRDKEYVFTPSTLGISLVEGYDNIGLEMSLSKPFLRSQLESNLKLICSGIKTKNEVVEEAINMYRNVFETVNRDKRVLQESLERYLGRGADFPPHPPPPPPPPRPQQPDNSGSRNLGSGDGQVQRENPRFISNSTFENASRSDGEFRPQHTMTVTSSVASSNAIVIMEAFLQNLQGGNMVDSKPRCLCGLVAMELKSSNQNGRVFWRCSKQNKQIACKFFKWDDELDPNQPSTPWSGGQQLQQSSSYQADLECYRCHEKGHFANACTNGTNSKYGDGNNGFHSNESTRTTSTKSKSKITTKRSSSKSGIMAVRVSKKARPI